MNLQCHFTGGTGRIGFLVPCCFEGRVEDPMHVVNGGEEVEVIVEVTIEAEMV